MTGGQRFQVAAKFLPTEASKKKNQLKQVFRTRYLRSSNSPEETVAAVHMRFRG